MLCSASRMLSPRRGCPCEEATVTWTQFGGAKERKVKVVTESKNNLEMIKKQQRNRGIDSSRLYDESSDRPKRCDAAYFGKPLGEVVTRQRDGIDANTPDTIQTWVSR